LPRSVTVSATGKAEATPDRAVLPVQVETRDKKLLTAKQKNDELAAKMLKVTETYKIPQAKLKTSGVHISPQYRWEQKTNKQIFDGYLVSRSVQITVDELEQTEKLIASLTEAGIDQVQGVQFTIADPEGLESAARKDAIAKAAKQADELAVAAGAKRGKALNISLSGAVSMPPPMPMRAMAMKADMAESAPPTLPGTLTVEQQVTVVYELE
jgi:hypothetical protein